MFFKNESVQSFQTVELKISGMRETEIYELMCGGDTTEVSSYVLRYASGKEDRQLCKQVTVDTAEVIGLLNDCRVMSWNGFSGKNPPHVLDGYMFTFRAVVNDGKKIYADGSNNYPKHYHDFKTKISEYLNAAH